MVKYLLAFFCMTACLLVVEPAKAQPSISGATKVQSGSSSCYSATTTCTTKTYCWSGINISSITPETSCSGGGGEQPAKQQGGTMIPNTGGGGGSCLSPAMALVVFPTVSTTTTATVVLMDHCGIQTTKSVTVVPPPNALTISPGSQQIVCSGTATTLTTSTPSGGDGTYAYQWYSSPDGSTWTAISGATGSTYLPPTPSVGTTVHYEVQLISFGMTATSTPVSVSDVTATFVPASVSPSAQTIANGTAPATLQGSNPSGGACGSFSYNYTWYYSTDGSNFYSTGVTTQNYSPGQLTQTTYYKLQTSISGGPSAYSNTVTVTVTPPLQGGAVSAPGTSICNGCSPSLSNVQTASGGNCGGGYSYGWWSGLDGTTYNPISGSSGASYNPGPLTVTTYFIRQVACGTEIANSNTIRVDVDPVIAPGTISPSSLNINYNTSPGGLSVSAGGGNGVYSYQWQSSANSSFTSPTNVGTNSPNYSPPVLIATTYYRVIVTSNGGAATSGTATVTVYPQVVAGAVSPVSQTIDYDSIPASMRVSGVSGGNGSYTYQWYSDASGTYQPIGGAVNASYAPGNLTATTDYEIQVTSNGASAMTAPVTVTVYPQLTAGSITGPASAIDFNTSVILGNSAGSTGGGCGGGYSYQWWKSTDGGYTYSQIAGATADTLATDSLTEQTLYYRKVTCGDQAVSSNTVTVNVAPELLSGLLLPSAVTISSGGNPGTLTCSPASGGNCSGSYQYIWQSHHDDENWATVSGVSGLSYVPGVLSSNTYFRVMSVCGADTVYTPQTAVMIGPVTSDWNYVRTMNVSQPGITDTASANALTDSYDGQQVTQYMDGLGRPIQAVARQASPLGKDMVTIQAYDAFGRSAVNYLPYTASVADGNFKPTAISDAYAFNSATYPSDQYYFGQVDYEPSPLDRPLTTFSPGNSWVGAGRGVESQYLTNMTADSVHSWSIGYATGSIAVDSGTYAPHTLIKTVTVDEQKHQVIEYKDKSGQTVLKKVQSSDNPGTAHVGWLNTYYVYDDLHNLRFVIPPRAVELINTSGTWTISSTVANGLCFRYEYDGRGRMIVKKVPGAGASHMIYDQRDRLVMSQDSALWSQEKWLFTCYDSLNRPDSAGMMTDPANYNNPSYHATQAMLSPTYPNLSGYSTELLTRTFYDDYSAISAASGLPSGMATGVTGNTINFITQYNSYPVYAVQPLPYANATGVATGTMSKVLGSSNTYLYTETFYDDHGRAIQVQSQNYTGGVDTVTTQYDFSGKPLRTLLAQAKPTNTAQYHQVATQMNYDAGFRVTTVRESIDGGPLQTLDSMQYDELGRLNAKYLGNNLDGLVFDYNIRGWMTGINKNYVSDGSTHFFGMELSYDNPASAAGTSYLHPVYNGNIAGTTWKTAGDEVNRKYDFTYDNVNRLTGAAYLEVSTGSWTNSKMDYTVDSLGYDANGNILSMYQHGFRVGAPTGLIDQLTYSYPTGSNQLSQVVDGANDTASMLGDFHYKTKDGSYDYTYDGNGNLTKDKNKGIDSIYYNYLNLPQRVHMSGKGNITYMYDAGGNKLLKRTADSAAGVMTTTLYLDGFQYQRRTALNDTVGGVDTLQFASNAEGRTRWALQRHLAGDSAYSWVYDFMERDHLGNTRVVLTQEKDTAQYVATMEPAYRATENALFYNIDSTSYAANQVPNGGFPTEPNGPVPNDSVAMVDGAGHKVGPAILLKVMSGDSISLGVYSYYASNGTVSSPNSSISNVINSLATGLETLTGGTHGGLAGLTNPGNGPIYGAVNSFLPSADTNTTAIPKAYLNWMLVDNQFNYVSGYNQSGALPVGQGDQLNTLATTIKLHHSGYLYIWVSNETPNWRVFFDNLSVEHFSGPMLEEEHYYPFGLTMAGISDEALKPQYAENKYRFNKGSELQNKEFADGSGLEMYETHLRELDPQLGRWWQIDPKPTEAESPYASMGNNPILRDDYLGDSAETNFVAKDGHLIKHINDGSNAVFQQTGEGTDLHYSFTGFDESQGGNDNVNLTTAVQEQQSLNIDNPALQQNAEGQNETHCNQATQDIMKTVASATGDKSVVITGNANTMTDKLNGTTPSYFKVDQNAAKQNAKNGGVSVIAYKNPTGGHGHILTYSVGTNIKKGETANVGLKSTTGFNSVNATISKTKPKSYYIMTHVQVQAPVTVTPQNNNQHQ